MPIASTAQLPTSEEASSPPRLALVPPVSALEQGAELEPLDLRYGFTLFEVLDSDDIDSLKATGAGFP